MKLHFVEFIKYTNRYQWYIGIGSFIYLYITWKKWNFIHKFPPMEILLNIWWESLHRNSRYCQNQQNRVTSCFPKMVIIMKKIFFVVNHQNIGCKLLAKEEKIWKFETWPFTHYQTRSGILKHCGTKKISKIVFRVQQQMVQVA